MCMRTANADGDDDWYIFRKQDTQSHEMGKVLIRDFESGNAIIFFFGFQQYHQHSMLRASVCDMEYNAIPFIIICRKLIHNILIEDVLSIP